MLSPKEWKEGRIPTESELWKLEEAGEPPTRRVDVSDKLEEAGELREFG
jgi:hypothetical protein